MKSKKRAIVLTLTLVLLIGGLVSATLAYFTDTEFAKDNVITIGDIEIDLYEHNAEYVYEGNNRPTAETLKTNDQAYQGYLDSEDYLLPGENVNKYTYIDNTGKNDAFVRFVVTVPGEIDGFLTYTWNDAYTVTRVAGATATDPVVYYVVGNEKLAAGALSEPGLEKVALNADLTEKDLAAFTNVFAAGTRDFNITVAAHAIQTVGFADADAAFAAFDGKNAEIPADDLANEKVKA